MALIWVEKCGQIWSHYCGKILPNLVSLPARLPFFRLDKKGIVDVQFVHNNKKLVSRNMDPT
jgi:hypothetical protein